MYRKLRLAHVVVPRSREKRAWFLVWVRGKCQAFSTRLFALASCLARFSHPLRHFSALFSVLQIFHPFAHCYLSCHRTTPPGATAIKGANMPNDVYETASAIAAFDATKVAFVALVKKGVLSKAEAEAILRKAIEAVKTEGAGEQAAELLAGILERLSNFPPAPRK